MRTVGAGPDLRRRVIVLGLLFLLAVAALTFQLLRLQVFDSERYVAWGEDQRFTTTSLFGSRGDLVDRNGEELAISLPAPVVYADPLLVSDPAAEAAALASVLKRPALEIQGELASIGRFVYLARPTSEFVADQIRGLNLDGIFIGEETERFHPNGEHLARGVLGAVGVDNVGLSGLEEQYDGTLSGTPGRAIFERGLNGRSIPAGKSETQPAVDGQDVQLTLDRALQFEVERSLAQSVAASGALGGIVIVAEPGSGEILAMASVAMTERGRVVSTSENRALTWTYEPASVMKAITFAAVLNEGLSSPSTLRVVQDQIDLYEETFSDNADYGSKIMTTTDIVVSSSNTGTVSWALDLGSEKFYEYLIRFGFGSSSLEFPGESSGILNHVGNWSGTDIATLAIGQGIAVTPMQMLAAYNVIANDGLYVAPQLVLNQGPAESSDVTASVGRRVISEETAADLKKILSLVVSRGTASRAQVPGYEIAAKTGTARKIQEFGGYVDAAGNFRYIATVAGFFPAENPRFSMIVIIDEPRTEIYASRISAPLFGDLAAWTLRHYQVSPGSQVIFGDADVESALAPTEDLVGR